MRIETKVDAMRALKHVSNVLSLSGMPESAHTVMYVREWLDDQSCLEGQSFDQPPEGLELIPSSTAPCECLHREHTEAARRLFCMGCGKIQDRA